MKLLLLAAFLCVCNFGYGQAAPALQRTRWTTNMANAIIPDGSVRRLTENDSSTKQVDGGGSSGSFVNTNLAGSNSGSFTNRYKYSSGNIVADEWAHLPGGNAFDFTMGLNIVDPSAEVFQKVWSYTNATADSTFRFWKPVALHGLSSGATPANGIGQNSDGLLVQIPNYGNILGASAYNDTVIEDFSQYPTGSNPALTGGFGWNGTGVITAASQIVPRVWLDGVTRNTLQINGKGDYARKWPWGTNWVKIRLGILWAATNSGASFTNTYAIGICKGTNGGFYNSANQNFFGTANNAAGHHDWNYSNALFAPYYDVVRLNSQAYSVTNGVSGNNTLSGSTGRGVAALPHFSALILDFTRQNANNIFSNDTITVTVNAPSHLSPADASTTPAVLNRRPTLATLINVLRTTPQLNVQDIVSTTTSSLAVSTKFLNFGQFDSFTFSWGGNTNLIEIAGIVGVKLY